MYVCLYVCVCVSKYPEAINKTKLDQGRSF